MMEKYIEKIKTLFIEFAPSIVIALVLLIAGLFAISIIVKTARKLMKKRGVDETLQSM